MRPDTIINEARPFDQRAFFYSRTDRRGVILSGNRMFFDISGYEVDQLVGAPHKVVRHPDMPRGAFHLVWETIQSGGPAVAFVKNLAQDGRYYWVMAVIIPYEDGYMSIRTGARGPLFDQTRTIYAEMLKAEAGGASPADSARLLLERLAEAGIRGFGCYGARVVAEQFCEADRSDCRVGRMVGLSQFIHSIAEARAALIETLRTLYLIPTNMRILASRLEPSGGPVSAISDSYKRAAAELMIRLNGTGRSDGHDTASSQSETLIEQAILLTSLSELIREAVTQFVQEPFMPGINARNETALLRGLAQGADTLADERVSQMMRSVHQIVREAENVKRLMAGLDQIRILGEVESGRMRNSDGGLAAIMSQLTSFHGLIHTRLTTMNNVAARMVGMEL